MLVFMAIFTWTVFIVGSSGFNKGNIKFMLIKGLTTLDIKILHMQFFICMKLNRTVIFCALNKSSKMNLWTGKIKFISGPSLMSKKLQYCISTVNPVAFFSECCGVSLLHEAQSDWEHSTAVLLWHEHCGVFYMANSV